MSKKIAVITGASSGMGREFVLALDKQQEFDELWLIARRRDRLEALASETRAPVRAIPLDLGVQSEIDKYKELLETEQPDVRVLVNAAGFGKFKAFTDLSLEEQLAMIDLNDKALVSVTYLTLPYMKEGSCIYQLGSLSSFQPVPYINVYGASKAFVLSFSRALNKELLAFAREAEDKKGMDAAQVTGSTSSYARKYALCGLLGLDDSKAKAVADPDTLSPADHEEAKDTERQEILMEIYDMDITRKEVDEQIAVYYKGKDADTIELSRLKALLKYYQKTKKAKES